MGKRRVLIICTHNSARSQIAETYLNAMAADRFEAESAGLEPGKINPLVVEVMKEDGFDLSGNESNSVFDFYREGRLYDTVITVCERETEQLCPVFPGVTHRLNWPFPDPAKLSGSHAEKLAEARKIRDAIKKRLQEWIAASGR